MLPGLTCILNHFDPNRKRIERTERNNLFVTKKTKLSPCLSVLTFRISNETATILYFPNFSSSNKARLMLWNAIRRKGKRSRLSLVWETKKEKRKIPPYLSIFPHLLYICIFPILLSCICKDSSNKTISRNLRRYHEILARVPEVISSTHRHSVRLSRLQRGWMLI